MYFKNSSLNYIPTTFGGEPKNTSYVIICRRCFFEDSISRNN
ncbi:hypothetical protein ACYO9X_03365 [Staphylococcus aureus]